MKLLITLSAFLLSAVVVATPLRNIVVFGDSLSDNGNLYEQMKHQLPQSPPYYEGRFSNGPVWVEYIASSYFPKQTSSRLLDYAVGGAGVSEDDEDDVLFTLRKQVQTYLISHHDEASPDDLYIVWIGANNYLGLPEEPDTAINNVVLGVTHSIELLVAKGAKHILVINLPDLGKTPAARQFDAEESMSYYANQHNKLLYDHFLHFKQNHPEVQWIHFDLNAMFTDVIDHPNKYELTNVLGTCANASIKKTSKKSLLRMVAQVTPKAGADGCDGYLFFDLVHPTRFAHERIAQELRILLDQEGIEFAP